MINDIKIIITIVVLTAILITSYFGYKTVYNRGVEQAKLECDQQRQKYELEITEKIQNLESALQQTAEQSERKKQQLTNTIREIKSKLNTQPTTIIENGKCMPSVIFLDSINEAISKANQK
jgi:ABC-type iron transport system FetAB ATPase subunit